MYRDLAHGGYRSLWEKGKCQILMGECMQVVCAPGSKGLLGQWHQGRSLLPIAMRKKEKRQRKEGSKQGAAEQRERGKVKKEREKDRIEMRENNEDGVRKRASEISDMPCITGSRKGHHLFQVHLPQHANPPPCCSSLLQLCNPLYTSHIIQRKVSCCVSFTSLSSPHRCTPSLRQSYLP